MSDDDRVVDRAVSDTDAHTIEATGPTGGDDPIKIALNGKRREVDDLTELEQGSDDFDMTTDVMKREDLIKSRRNLHREEAEVDRHGWILPIPYCPPIPSEIMRTNLLQLRSRGYSLVEIQKELERMGFDPPTLSWMDEFFEEVRLHPTLDEYAGTENTKFPRPGWSTGIEKVDLPVGFVGVPEDGVPPAGLEPAPKSDYKPLFELPEPESRAADMKNSGYRTSGLKQPGVRPSIVQGLEDRISRIRRRVDVSVKVGVFAILAIAVSSPLFGLSWVALAIVLTVLIVAYDGYMQGVLRHEGSDEE